MRLGLRQDRGTNHSLWAREMQLIKDVSISRFRSIREANLEGLQDFSTLAGLNNSGKSNFLRALHLFFTGAVEPATPFELDRDYYRAEVRSKKKKVIEVGVRFELPDSFKFRKGLEPVEALLQRDFRVTKRWSRDSPEPDIILNDESAPLSREDALKVLQFLGLITFRYIPNRVVATDVIAAEQPALRDVLIRRLARYKQQSADIFEGIQSTAESVISDMAAAVGAILPDVTRMRLDTASSLAELAFRFGYRLQEGVIETEEVEQGSGVQSLLMFQTLHLIDRDYFQRFGWRQAAFWAVEEPESSLHTSLEAEVARFLGSIMNDPEGRLQGMATTHSDLVVQYSDSAFLVSKDVLSGGNFVASSAQALSPRELLRETARFGISRWVNPVLYYYIEPLVLVEGASDRAFVSQGLRLITGKEYRVAALSDLLNVADKGGVETIRRFLKDNADAIRARPETAPVIVILDWDASAKADDLRKPFSSSDPVEVMSWDALEANPVLDKTFRGVERFFSDERIASVDKAEPDLIATKRNGVRTVSKEDYTQVKALLAGQIGAGVTKADLQFAEPFLRRLSNNLSVED